MSATSSPRRSFGLRPRLVGLVLAAVAPFLLLIGMVARQHRFNERSAAELQALAQARALGDRVDSRIGAIETLILTLIHSVSTNPRDSLRNDKLLRDVIDELPPGFAHFAVVTLKGDPIGTSDTLPNGKRRAITFSSAVGDTALDFDIQEPAPNDGRNGAPAIAISHVDSTLAVRMIGLLDVSRLQRELSRSGLAATSIATIIDPRGTVIFRSRSPEKWLGKNVAASAMFRASHAQKEGVAEVQDIDAGDVFSGYITARHVPWTVQVGSPQFLAFAKERTDFW